MLIDKTKLLESIEELGFENIELLPVLKPMHLHSFIKDYNYIGLNEA